MNWGALRRLRRRIGVMFVAGPKAAWRVVLALWRLVVAIVSGIGREELTVGAGVALIALALWPAIGQLALLPAGVILIWLGLPARTRFIAPPNARRDKGNR